VAGAGDEPRDVVIGERVALVAERRSVAPSRGQMLVEEEGGEVEGYRYFLP
jgi:hypothetical protein